MLTIMQTRIGNLAVN